MMMRPLHNTPPGDRGSKTCIVIVGPTAVGKTSLAIQVAQYFATTIVSCDSRQCFKELNIGVARPSPEELALVHHDFIASHSIHELVTAATFESYAMDKVNAIFQQHDVAVMVGGTGLYVKAFCEGLDELPAIDPAVRNGIIEKYQQEGMEWLTSAVQTNDPAYTAKGEMYNPQRMMRALEVVQSTGRSILDFQSNTKKQRPFNIITIGLEMPRPLLIERIHQRVDEMMLAGQLEEARSLVHQQSLNALQTVGYRELFSYFNGDSTLAGAIESIKINTRQYAKRQMTWFKKDAAVRWCSVDVNAVLQTIREAMA